MVRELAEKNFLKDFGQEGEVWHWSVVFQDIGVKSSFLEELLHDRWFESRGEKAGVQIVTDDRCEVWKKIVKTMGKKRCWQRIQFARFYCRLCQYFLHFIFRDRLKGTPNRATERLIGYREQGDSSWVKIAMNGSYLTVKEVRKALWKSRERNGRG